jgi:hypothetical protein
VATELTQNELRRLARLGAERRIEELRREEASIRAAFPDLDATDRVTHGTAATRRSGRPRKAAAEGAERGGGAAAQESGRKRRRRTMTAAEKRAVSERMKKYWAGRRKSR